MPWAKCELSAIVLAPNWQAVHGSSARTPTAELPNTAAFLGGLVAQETIKMITRQYVPIKGYCVVDLVDSWTALLDGWHKIGEIAWSCCCCVHRAYCNTMKGNFASQGESVMISTYQSDFYKKLVH